MNGLYGYPSTGISGLGYHAPSGMGVLPIVGAAIGPVTRAAEAVKDIISGNTKKDLQRAQRTLRGQGAKLGQRKNEIAAMPEGSAKQQAIQALATTQQIYSKEVKTIQAAITKYSDIVRTIETASLGYVKPPQLAGLGLGPAAVAALPAIIAAVGIAAVGLATLVGSFWLLSTDFDKAMLALTELVKAGGGAITKTGEFLSRTALLAVVLIGGYVGYQYFQKRRGGGGFTAPKQLTMKPVSGRVL